MSSPTIPNIPRIQPLPPGDGGRTGALTRLRFVDDNVMPIINDETGERLGAMTVFDEDAQATVIMVRRSLDPAMRKVKVHKLRKALRRSKPVGAEDRPPALPGLTAWIVITAYGLRQAKWRWPGLRVQDFASTAGPHVVAALAVTGVAVTVGTGAWVASSTDGPPGMVKGSSRWDELHPVYDHLAARPNAYLGAYEAASQDGSYTQMKEFSDTVGRTANVAEIYTGWEQKFPMALADAAAAHGATPLVTMNPSFGTPSPGCSCGVSLRQIAGGTYDPYLTRFADDVHAYGRNVIINFGHEFNGNWYPWGWGHTSPAQFVQAWRHVVDVFRSQGDFNVTWLWDPNEIGGPDAADQLGAWWPGAAYVTWAGMDAYFRQADDTFGSVFAPTIAQIRAVTGAPLLIAETAIGPSWSESWQLDNLFASIDHGKYLGLLWFDKDVRNSRGRILQPYRLEDNPSSPVTRQIIAVFRKWVGPNPPFGREWNLLPNRAGVTGPISGN